jgi:hypothetical protein
MVKVTLLEYLTSGNFDRKGVIRYLDEGGNKKEDTVLRSLKWHDPCVGSGVFPLTIVNLYNSLNIDSLPEITAFDINPFMVCATIIRLSYITNYSTEYERNIDYWKNRILLQNTLLLDDAKQYDVIIGNPPYVQADRIDKNLKTHLRRTYNFVYHNKADMYIYFLAYGISKLSNRGILCYISPAQFQKSNYGANVRKFIAEECLVRNIFDFDELQIFEGVSIHGSVYCIEKSKIMRDVYTHVFDKVDETRPLFVGLKNATMIEPDRISRHRWSINSKNADSIINILESGSVKLIEYCGQIYSGIKTNCSSIYVVDEKKLRMFDCAEQEKHFKPMYLAKKIRTWKSTSEDYMLVIKQGESLDESSQVYAYLLKNREKNSGSGDRWYCLRACSYYDKFALPKIIYPDIATTCRFTMDLRGYMIPDGAYFIPQEDYFLLGVLNSCIGRYFYKERCASIGNPQNGGRLRFKKIYVEHFPVKSIGDCLTKANLSVEIAQIARESTVMGEISIADSRRLDELAALIYEVPQKYLDEVLKA